MVNVDRLRFIEGCIDRYADVAWRTAYVSLRNAAGADDLLQQAYLVAWQKADNAPQDRAWPWLAGIIVREAQNFRRQAAQPDSFPEPATITQDKLEQAELAALVHIALFKLSFEQRIAIVLTHLAGLSEPEAADALGIPLADLKTRLHEGLGAMLDFLGERVADLSATLRKLPIAAPTGGIAAAKVTWVSALSGSVAVPVVSATAKVAAACLWAAAAAAMVALMVMAQPTPSAEEPVRTARTNGQVVPAAGRVIEPPEPVKLPPSSVPAPEPEVPEPFIPQNRPQVEPSPEPPPLPPVSSDYETEETSTSPRWSFPELPEKWDERSIGPKTGYEAVAGISGNVNSVGSDTLSNLMTLWVEGFRKSYPNVTFTVESKGSSTAPVALTDGTADLGPMSREMKQEEIDKFESKWGYRPSCVAVAIDALAVYVHKDNPIESLSLTQVDAIFSSTRKGGGELDITNWGQLGLMNDWANAEIALYGRNSTSGTYGYFKQHALFKGDYKKTVKEKPGSAAVVQAVSEDINAIGYSNIGAKTTGVRAVPISKKTGEDAYEATADNCYSGDYPLSRYLYIYFNRPPGKPLNPVVQEFLRFIHCKEGQEIVEKDGFIPLKQEIVNKFTDPYR